MYIKSLIQQIFTPDEVRYAPMESKPYNYFSEVFAPIYAKGAQKNPDIVKQDVLEVLHNVPVIAEKVQSGASGQYNPISKTISISPEIMASTPQSTLVHEYSHALDYVKENLWTKKFPLTENQYLILDQAYPGKEMKQIYKNRYKFALPNQIEFFKKGEQRAVNNELRYHFWKEYSAKKRQGQFNGSFEEYIDQIPAERIEQYYRIVSGYYYPGGDQDARKKALKEVAQNNFSNPYKDPNRIRA